MKNIEKLSREEVLKMATDVTTPTDVHSFLLRKYGEIAVVSNPNFDQMMLRNWATSINEEYRLLAARNPALPDDLREILKNDTCERVRQALV